MWAARRCGRHADVGGTLMWPARHGKRGHITQAYQGGQEDQLAALGLVLNAVVLWNTRYLESRADPRHRRRRAGSRYSRCRRSAHAHPGVVGAGVSPGGTPTAFDWTTIAAHENPSQACPR